MQRYVNIKILHFMPMESAKSATWRHTERPTNEREANINFNYQKFWYSEFFQSNLKISNMQLLTNL